MFSLLAAVFGPALSVAWEVTALAIAVVEVIVALPVWLSFRVLWAFKVTWNTFTILLVVSILAIAVIEVCQAFYKVIRLGVSWAGVITLETSVELRSVAVLANAVSIRAWTTVWVLLHAIRRTLVSARPACSLSKRKVSFVTFAVREGVVALATWDLFGVGRTLIVTTFASVAISVESIVTFTVIKVFWAIIGRAAVRWTNIFALFTFIVIFLVSFLTVAVIWSSNATTFEWKAVCSTPVIALGALSTVQAVSFLATTIPAAAWANPAGFDFAVLWALVSTCLTGLSLVLEEAGQTFAVSKAVGAFTIWLLNRVIRAFKVALDALPFGEDITILALTVFYILRAIIKRLGVSGTSVVANLFAFVLLRLKSLEANTVVKVPRTAPAEDRFTVVWAFVFAVASSLLFAQLT